MAKAQTTYTAKDFFLEDVPRTLFPLTTNRVLVEHGADKLLSFAENLLAGAGSFLSQQRVYANKDAMHLRRTVKLDAVAEYYLYHIIFKNRTKFRKPHNPKRAHYGYRFEQGRPVSPSKSYAEFKGEIWLGTFNFEEFIGFDIASYFNGVYHHDLQAWFGSIGASESDVESFGKYLRQINAGRSLDCLPQGIYPAKMIGNDFLRFIEESALIRSAAAARFMDDIYLFDNDEEVLKSDFAHAQRLLGLKGLSVNAAKTEYGGTPKTDETDDQISELKKRLLKRRRSIIVSHYDEIELDDDDEDSSAEPLDGEEIEYIVSMLKDASLSEEDAELILVVARNNAEILAEYLPLFARGFPHLAKNFYSLCADIPDKAAVARVVLDVASEGEQIGEYQLFWFGMMLETYLMDTALAPDIIHALFKHPSATDISRAKVLEIADARYGLPELREPFLREGRSDWLAWSSAVGCRHMKRSPRNYALDYFGTFSPYNALVAEIVRGI